MVVQLVLRTHHYLAARVAAGMPNLAAPSESATQAVRPSLGFPITIMR